MGFTQSLHGHLFNSGSDLIKFRQRHYYNGVLFSEHDQLRGYRDAKHARSAVLNELYRLIEANSLFIDKLNFPDLEASRLKTIKNQW